MTNEARTLLEICNLEVRFTARKKVLAVMDGVGMSTRPGEIVGVTGESGSGKSVMSQPILRLREYDPDMRYEGQILSEGRDLLKVSQVEMHGIRGDRIAVIFQGPITSLSPMHTVGRQLPEVLVLHKRVARQRARGQCGELLHLTGIPNPEDCMGKHPYELSSGMQQRVMIVVALSCEPKLLIADKPTTALDIATQEQILNSTAGLNERMGMSALFITHDLGVMAQICRSVRVMYLGNLVGEAQTEELFTRPMHPYTQGLLDCILRLSLDRSQPLCVIFGVMPPLSSVPDGCRFCAHCPYTDQHYVLQNPPSVEVFPGYKAKCWRYISEQEAE